MAAPRNTGDLSSLSRDGIHIARSGGLLTQRLCRLATKGDAPCVSPLARDISEWFPLLVLFINHFTFQVDKTPGFLPA